MIHLTHALTCFTPLLLIQLFKPILVLDWEDDVFIADGSLEPGRIELSQTLASGDDCMKEHGGVAFSQKKFLLTNFILFNLKTISFCGGFIMAILNT